VYAEDTSHHQWHIIPKFCVWSSCVIGRYRHLMCYVTWFLVLRVIVIIFPGGF